MTGKVQPIPRHADTTLVVQKSSERIVEGCTLLRRYMHSSIGNYIISLEVGLHINTPSSMYINALVDIVSGVPIINKVNVDIIRKLTLKEGYRFTLTLPNHLMFGLEL